jgi:hypothetical protein
VFRNLVMRVFLTRVLPDGEVGAAGGGAAAGAVSAYGGVCVCVEGVPAGYGVGVAGEEGTMSDNDPSWGTWREAVRVVLHPPYLKKTTRIALLVGSLLFVVNHYDALLAGKVSRTTLGKGAVTCLVPFSVANWGILTARRRKEKS